MKLSERIFGKFYVPATSFISKKRKIFAKIINVLRFQATIAPQRLQIAGNSLPKQAIALTERNTTGPPCSVTDPDRRRQTRQRAKQYWPTLGEGYV